MKENAEFSFSIRIAENKNGIPKPKEYASSNKAPFIAPPVEEASINAEPRKAPTQGVRLTE